MDALRSLLAWLGTGNHAASVSAVGSFVSACFAFAAFLVAVIGLTLAVRNLRIARRSAKSSIEPWLELAPKKMSYNARWDMNETEIEVQLPESTEFVGTRGSFKGPGWPLGNIGGGPAADIEVTWRFDGTELAKSIVRARQAVGKDLEIGSGFNVIDKGRGRIPITHIADRKSDYVGFRTAGKDENDFVDIEIPSYILNCVTLHVLSAAVKFGEYAAGQIDVFIQYKNKFLEDREKQFYLEYSGCPLWDDAKKVLACTIELQVKQNRTEESFLRRIKHEVRTRRGVRRFIRELRRERN